MVKRIALVGASSTGKTTVYELLKTKLPTKGFKQWQFVNESTRTVASYGFPINENGTDATQLAISSFHLEALMNPFYTIYDRGYMDLLVYSKYMPNLSENTYKFIEDTWNRIKDEYTNYIYFPIEFKSVDDGVRSINEEWRENIDKAFKEELDKLDTPYLTVTGSPLQRVEQILEFIK